MLNLLLTFLCRLRHVLALSVIVAACVFAAYAQKVPGLAKAEVDSLVDAAVTKAVSNRFVPDHAVVLHGDIDKADTTVLAVFYSRENMDFRDVGAPRFLLLDREGKVSFGIGGTLYALASYDFMGAIDGSDFITYDIKVPSDPEYRQRFGADARSSSLFAKLVGRSDRFGLYSVYFQGQFSGNGTAYGFKLKQAYVNVWRLTAGLTTSTFVDAQAQAPTIDPEGACGDISDKSMLFRYTSPVYGRHWRYAVSAELPSGSYTTADGADGQPLQKAIAQRVPDIPAYLQYQWDGGHVRASGVFRALAYRDLVAGQNRLVPCWGAKLTAVAKAGPVFEPFGHISYGKGISAFVNDLGGNGLDLVWSTRPGRMCTVPSLTWTVGTYVHFTGKLFATGSLSRAQVFDCMRLGQMSYRYSMYGCANIFYDFNGCFRVGAEYLHGLRADQNGAKGTANRVNVLLQYSF